MLSFMGFIIYYFIPLTFFYGQLQWFTFLLNLIFIMIIFGLVFLAQIVLPSIEKNFLSGLLKFSPSDQKLHKVIARNLEQHQPRNGKTSLLFTVSLGFLIFSSASFDQVQLLTQNLLDAVLGADMVVFVVEDKPGEASSIRTNKIVPFLTSQPIV